MADPADVGSAGTGPRRRRRWRRALAETAITILVAVLLAGLVRAFAFPTFWIPSASMVPTLGVYDRVLVQKAFFTWRDVREGDIVVFSHLMRQPVLGADQGPEHHRQSRADVLARRPPRLPPVLILAAVTAARS